VIEARLQRGDQLRERRALEIRERLGLVDQHRRRTLDDVLLQHEREHIEERLFVGVGERFTHVRGDLADVGSGRHVWFL
jgi:hypothetical protein